ncbi:DNA-binding protein [Escherichia coli]|nr:DNA-binding protein [Escherichia coli]
MTKHSVVPFTFESHSIRAINLGGEPWFVAEDICNTLNLSNPTMSLKSLDEDERSKFNLGRQGEVNIVNESGMYTLVLRCRDAVKKGSVPHRFRKWVTAEVLPSIRKNGAYAKPKARQCTAKQLTPLRQTAERLITTGLGKIYPDIWKLVHQRFDVEHIHQLQPEQVGEAIEYLNVLEGEYLGREALPATPSVHFTNEELCALCWVWNAAEYMREKLELAYPAMRTLKSEYVPSFYSMAFEYQRTLEAGRKVLERETKHIVPHPHSVSDENWRRVLPRLRQNSLPRG